jgi:septal ring factor EnvC (AmiA/AmiB activator)
VADDPAIATARQKAARVDLRRDQLNDLRGKLDDATTELAAIDAALAAGQDRRTRVAARIAQGETAVAAALAALQRALADQPDPP